MAVQQNLWVLPWLFRPTGDPEDGETDEWADNKLSNSLAWASQVITHKWCETPEHWTTKLADYLYTSCPCCMLVRGIVLGWTAAWLAGLGIGALGWLTPW